MSVEDLVARMERIPGARVGRGPRHPKDPDLSIGDEVDRFLGTYQVLRSDTGYAEFLEKYSGAMIANPEETQIVDILGFSEVSTEMLEMDGPIVDDDGYLLFAQVIFHIIDEGRLVDMYEHDFAFDVSGRGPAGVYCRSATLRSQESSYTWHKENFCAWFAELVDKGGRYERPSLT